MTIVTKTLRMQTLALYNMTLLALSNPPAAYQPRSTAGKALFLLRCWSLLGMKYCNVYQERSTRRSAEVLLHVAYTIRPMTFGEKWEADSG